MNKLPSWRFWLPFFFQSALILITPIQAIYTHRSKESEVRSHQTSCFTARSRNRQNAELKRLGGEYVNFIKAKKVKCES